MQPLATLNFGAFLDEIGAKTPAPGGGAVASATGALGAALAKMVVAYSIGKKNLAEHQETLERASKMLSKAGEILLVLADEDAAAYALVNELSKLPEDDARRVAEYAGAVEAAVNVPRAVVGTCCDVLRLLEQLAPITNKHLRSDLAIAAILAEAAARSGWWNVAVNLTLIEDEIARQVREEMMGMLEDAAARRARVERACGE